MKMLQVIINSRLVERIKRKSALITGMHLKLKRLSPSASENYRIVKILANYNLTKVLDIGANAGQFAETLIDFGYKGEIISFEPTSKAYIKLQKRARRHKKWSIADKMAIGNYNGNIDINVAENSLFSSVKNISKDYSEYNKSSQKSTSENVPIKTLDSLENIFLKIDTQGFEKEVLEGAKESLKFIKAVKIEIPLVSIYNNVNWSLKEIVDFFAKLNFKCIDISEVAVNNKTGIVHEVDGVFIRKEYLNNY